MKYFKNIRTLDDLKKEFRRLAMLHHPDRGGDTATMQAINAEFEMLFPALKLAAKQPGAETAESLDKEHLECLCFPFPESQWRNE